MARKSSITKLNKIKLLHDMLADKRLKFKSIANDKTISMEERFAAQQKLQTFARNSSKVRQRNRCNITGRPRGYYRFFGLSRIALRELASIGYLPGTKKSSW